MYELETITRITLAIARLQTPDTVIETGSRQFNAVWQTYMDIIRQELGHTHAAWDKSAGTITNASHTGITPYSQVQFAARAISLNYLRCAQEHAAIRSGDIHAASRKDATNGPISEQLGKLMSTVRNISAYLDTPAAIKLLAARSQEMIDATTEFYCIAMVALHELRRSAPSSLQQPMDTMLVHCDHQMSNFDLVSILPLNLEKEVQLHVNDVHQFHLGIALGREGAGLDDGPQQQQRLQPTSSAKPLGQSRGGFYRRAPQATTPQTSGEPAKLFDLKAERTKRGVARVAGFLTKGKDTDPATPK